QVVKAEFPDIIKEQTNDSQIAQIIKQILDPTTTPSDEVFVKFAIHDDILYKVNHESSVPLLTLYVPKSLRQQALKSVHNDPQAGHFGFHKTWQRLRSHHGSQFEFQEFKDFCTSLNIELKFASPYSPNVNGLITTPSKRTLAKLLHDHGGDLEAQLHPAVFAHNTSSHSVTKHSPFFLVHGREARLSCDNTFPTFPILGTPECPITRSKAAEVANSSSKDNTIKFQAHQSQKYNDTHPTTLFSSRPRFTRPIRIHPGKVQKFEPKWRGPYKILRQLGPITYEIQDLRPYRRQQDKIFAANARLLKKYIPPDSSFSLPSQPSPEPNSNSYNPYLSLPEKPIPKFYNYLPSPS
ncbi:Pro-Pol polyprotein, partial [Orchesella cincta]